MGTLLTALSACKTVRVFVAETKDIVQKLRDYHNASPVVTAALGRLLTAASIIGTFAKGEKDIVTLQIHGDGPVKTLVATADAKGNVKGYAGEYLIDLPLKSNGKLDVGGAVGQGTLTVVRDDGAGEMPYVGKVPLVSGEIAEDITSYFAVSEQIPTVCALGVLIDTDLSVRSAGGVIIQLMPGASEQTIDTIEQNIAALSNVSSLFIDHSPEQIAEKALKNIGISMHYSRTVAYKCDCSEEKCERMLSSLSARDLRRLIDEDHKADIVCNFCSSIYHFDEKQLLAILQKK